MKKVGHPCTRPWLLAKTKQNVSWELKFNWQTEKSTVGQNVILRQRFKMAANIKGIFLNNTININTYLVT